jgi:hypothetical protein
MKKIFFALIVGLLVSVGVPSYSAGQHTWASAYLDWNGLVLSEKSSISQIIQPLEISPQTYWSSTWVWDNSSIGGYGGIQTKGYLANGQESDMAIFSIWDATTAFPGEGGGCRKFGGEGVGYTCSTPITIEAGSKYEMNYSMDLVRGKRWWTASIFDFDRQIKKVIGSIEAPYSGATATRWGNFIEYWGKALTCDGVGKASAKFSNPTSSNPDVEVTFWKYSKPLEPCVMTEGDTPPYGTIGDAIIRFGGAFQSPSTVSMPFTKNRKTLEAEAKAAAELKAKQEAETKAAAELKAKQEAEAKAASLKKTTITCVKGKLTKKVTAVKPKCSAGYKIKK